jgi:ABC-type nickel/cobalt efflux system permease component RcnA
MLSNLATAPLTEAVESASHTTEYAIVLTNVLLVLVTGITAYFMARENRSHVEHVTDSANESHEVEQAALLRHEDREEARLAHIIHEVIAAEHEREEHENHPKTLSAVKDEPAA